VLRRSFRIGLLVGLLGGALAAVAKAVQSRTSAPEPAAPASWTPLPKAEPVVVPPRVTTPTVRATAPIADLQEPLTPPRGTPAVAAPTKKAATSKKAAPTKKPEAPAAPAAPWVDPVDGDAPASHPIKAKMSSGIFHSPGGLNYERTKPDRCYRDAAAAEADGLRPAKR
jgi:hypothetical protein